MAFFIREGGSIVGSARCGEWRLLEKTKYDTISGFVRYKVGNGTKFWHDLSCGDDY